MISCQNIDWSDPQIEEMLPSPLYSQFNIDYQKYYMEDFQFEDRSLAIYDNNQLSAVLLLTRGVSSLGEVAYNWYGLPVVYLQHISINRDIDSILKKITNFIFQEKKFSLSFKIYHARRIPLIINDALDDNATCENVFESIIDLTNSLTVIHKNIRKSYKNTINKSRRTLTHKIINSSTITQSHIHDFRNFHILVSGRETRSQKTWEEQYNIIKKGNGFLVISSITDVILGYSLYLNNKNICYYGVGAYNRNYFNSTFVSHGAIWTAIEYAKYLSCKKFILGKIFYPFQKLYISEKEYNIGIFKRGFSQSIEHSILVKLNK